MLRPTSTTATVCSVVLRHAAALGLVAVCCLGRWLANPLLGGRLPVLPAAVATVIAARWLGAGPGILAVVYGIVAGHLLFSRPYAAWDVVLVRDGNAMVVSGLVGLLVVWTVARLRSQADRLGREVAIRKRAETAAEAARLRLEQFLDAAPLCAYMKDANGRFVFLNRHIREVYPDVVAGSTVHETFASAQAEEFSNNDDWVRRTGQAVACEEVATGAGGVLRHWSTFKFPITDADGRRGVGGISIEITDRKQADERATRTESLLRRLIEVQEREKQSLCHEFHDGLMQYAIAARMLLEGWRQGRPDGEAALVDEAIRSIDAGIADGRRTIRGIRPAVLDDLGLKAAAEELADGLSAGGLAVETTIDPGVDGLPTTVQTTAFRILQEATANARRHSGSDRLRIELRREADDVVLTVEDFGRGFDAASPPHTGFGIVGMIERARLGGGSCRVTSVPGRGTRVTARLAGSSVDAPAPGDPLAAAARADGGDVDAPPRSGTLAARSAEPMDEDRPVRLR